MARLLAFSVTVLVLLAAWYLNSSLAPRKPPIVNDDCTEFFDPRKLQLPSTEAGIVRIVTSASEEGRKIRVLGSGHSRNSLAFSRDVIMSLENFKGVVHLNMKDRQVTVRAGTTLFEMVSYLDEHGLALGVLPAILEQTVAGAISTGTHGCRSNYGNLASLVTKLKMVTAEGEVTTVSEDDPDHFEAARVSLGLLGVITEVTFQCEPSFNLEEKMEKMSLDACLGDLNEIAYSAEHVKLWVELYSGSCDVYRFERTEKEPRMNSLIWRNLKMHLWEPFLWLSSWLPSLAPTLISTSVLQGGVFYPEYTQVGKSYEVLTSPLYVPQNNQIEFSVDIAFCVAALRAFKSELEKWKPASVFIEVRFVSPDDIWMSLNYQRQSCHLTVIIYNPSDQMKRGYFNSLHQALRDMNAKPRPHFGKFLNITAKELQEIYPKYPDFKHLRTTLDPSGVFLNVMLEKLF